MPSNLYQEKRGAESEFPFLHVFFCLSISDRHKKLAQPMPNPCPYPAADVSPAVPTSILWPGVELVASDLPSWWIPHMVLDVKKGGHHAKNTIFGKQQDEK